jgi:hypothetical protein
MRFGNAHGQPSERGLLDDLTCPAGRPPTTLQQRATTCLSTPPGSRGQGLGKLRHATGDGCLE